MVEKLNIEDGYPKNSLNEILGHWSGDDLVVASTSENLTKVVNKLNEVIDILNSPAMQLATLGL